MSIGTQRISHATSSATLADVLERVLDQGLVIAGDIKVKLVEIELLTIQIRLVVCSVDKAIEMGMDWWTTNPNLSSRAREALPGAAVAAGLGAGAGAGAEAERTVGDSLLDAGPRPDAQHRQDRIAALEAELAGLRADPLG